MNAAGLVELARLLPGALLLLDANAVVLGANRACAELLSRSPDRLVGRSLRAQVGDEPERVEQLLRLFARSSEPLPGALTFVDDDGDPTVTCRVWGCRVGSGAAAPLLLRLELRGAQAGSFAMLTRQLDELTREVALRRVVEQERARALSREREARAEAERALASLRVTEEALRRAVAARDQLIWVASHELRGPLNTLTLQVEGLRRAVGSLDERARRRIEGALRQVERLGRLVGDLLDVSRIAAGALPLRPEPMDLAELVEQLLERERDTLVKAGCALTLRRPPDPVIGEWDPVRIEQALLNLLSNAAKFGGGQPIEVEVVDQGDRVQVHVVDHGIGIAAEDQARIFQRFERAVSHERFGGLGLGLWISEHIARDSGGAIRLESAPGDGARFTLELPRLGARGRPEQVQPPGRQ